MPAYQADGMVLLNLARDRARVLLDRLRADAEDLRLNTKIEPMVAERGLVVLLEAIESAQRLLVDVEEANRGEE